ncbi:hypothetical protein ACFSTC_20320 [Nonomuraea ferruginea]
MRQWTLADVLPKLTQPLLIVHGENDRQVAVEDAHKAYEAAQLGRQDPADLHRRGRRRRALPDRRARPRPAAHRRLVRPALRHAARAVLSPVPRRWGDIDVSTDTDVSTGTAGDGRGKVTLDDVHALCERYRNWGKWGPDDQIGTLNYIEPEMVVAASALVRQGKVISCALPYDGDGPQNGWGGRVNPIHLMLQDGGDAAIGAQDHMARLRYADDAVYMPLQSGTQWDALSHVFYEGKMYNGFGQEHVSSTGAGKCGIELTTEKVVGRGCCSTSPPPPRRAVAGARSGHRQRRTRRLRRGAGRHRRPRRLRPGPHRAHRHVPGAGLVGRLRGCTTPPASRWTPRTGSAATRSPAVATDTWGMEVRPNETDEIFQPVHIVLLVNADLLIGEIFDLEKLADDCAADGVYEFMFAAGPLPFTKAVGSPLNPLAIK